MGINRVEGAPFAQIANEALRDTRLSFRARGILGMVLSHTGDWQANRDWIARQSEKEGRQAIQTALNELTALGYRRVHKERTADGNYVTVTSWYHHPQGQLVQESTEPDGELVQESAEGQGELVRFLDRPENRPSGNWTAQEPVRLSEDHLLQNTITEHQKNSSSLADASDGVSDPFDEFWKHYPRKVGKPAARKAFKQALKRATAADITAGAERLRYDPNLPDKSEEQYIPHASTWLNRDGWDDPPLPARQTNRPQGRVSAAALALSMIGEGA